MVVYYIGLCLSGVSLAAFIAATFWLSRRWFIYLGALPLLVYGIGCHALPAYTLTLAVVEGSPGPEHYIAYSHLGKSSLGIVALVYFYRNSEDGKVTNMLLTLIAQTSLAQMMALGSFHYNQDVLAKKTGLRPDILLNTDVNLVLYISLGLWFLVTVGQYVRGSPLQAGAILMHGDKRVAIHRAILCYVTLIVSLFMIANPDIIRILYAESMQSKPPMDYVEKFAFQLAGAFFLCQALAVHRSEDFVKQEDQAGVFKAHLVVTALGIASLTEHVVTGKITVEDSLSTLVFRLLLALNSIAAIIYTKDMKPLDREDQKIK